MSTEKQPRANQSTAPDRRRAPRLEVMGRMRGHLRALGLPLRLINLSDGGFLMQAPIDFVIGGTHEFRFTPPDGEPIVLTARVVHTKPADQAGVYVVGLEFEEQDTAAYKQAIAALLDLLRA